MMTENVDHTHSYALPGAVRTVSIPCCLCRQDDSESLFDARDRLHGGPGVFRYVRCTRCGLVYMNPQVIPEDLGKLYPADYGPHHAKGNEDQESRASCLTDLGRKSFVRSLCARLTPQSRILDLGCGSGAFLHKVRVATGCRVQGVDSSPAAAKTAREIYDIDVFIGTLPEAPFPTESFDAITAWCCLEHVPNPAEVMRRIHELLRPGGSCLLGVPNVASFNAKVFRDKWYHLDCPRHLYLYSPDTLKRLAKAAGLPVEEIAFDRSSRGLIQSLRYRFGDDVTPLRSRKNPAGQHLLKVLATPFTALLAMCGQADQMVMHARKPSAVGARQ